MGSTPCRDDGLLASTLFLSQFFEHPGEHGGDRGQVVCVGVSSQDLDAGAGRLLVVFALDHSGMFPCFFGGWTARLVRSARMPLITTTRVAAGSMIPSSSPRSAARNGDATL